MAKDLKDTAITAAEAKEISETTTLYLNRIYKAIREEAKEGKTAIYWDRQHVSTKLLSETKKTLEAAGFSAGYTDNCLKISWE